MPEGDTVCRTAELLDRALAGQVLTATDFRVPAARHRRPHRRDRRRDRRPRQAPAHPHRAAPTTDPAHPPQDGGRLAGLPPRRALAAPGAHRRGWSSRPRAGRPSASRSASSSCSPATAEDERRRAPRPRPARPRLGRRRGGRRLPRPRRADRRGAARPAQPRRHRQPLRRRALLHHRGAPGTPVATCPTCARLVRRAPQMLEGNKERAGSPRPATCAGATGCGSTAATGQPCRRCGTRSRSRCRAGRTRAGDVLVPQLPARR